MDIGDLVDVTFGNGCHATNGAHQWECVEIVGKVTRKYLVDNHSPITPHVAGQRFRCQVVNIPHISKNHKFMIIRLKLLKLLSGPIVQTTNLEPINLASRRRKGATGFHDQFRH